MRIQLARPQTQTEAKARPVDLEVKVGVGGAGTGVNALAATQLLEADDVSGRVTAIVGITGVVDHVNDLIRPGAYKKTLAKRRPKVCFNHSWDEPIGRVVAIEEWMPGDPRFNGLELDGKAWPREGGALVATMEFNLKSDRARDAYHTVVFFSDSNECEWSIGWNPVPGKSAKARSGVRVCSEVELFEVSPVLFGAAPLTRTLSLKAASQIMMERKGLLGRLAKFEEDEHPRDRNGQFLEVGAQVRIWGTQKRGRITKAEGQRYTVELFGSREERKIPRGLLLVNNDVMITAWRNDPGSTVPGPVAVGWADPTDPDALAKLKPVEDTPRFRAIYGSPRAQAKQQAAWEKEQAEQANMEARAAEMAKDWEAEHAEQIEAERQAQRDLFPAQEAYTAWTIDSLDELSKLDPAEAAKVRSDKFMEIMSGPLGQLERERQGLVQTKGLLPADEDLVEPGPDDVEVISDDDDGIDYELMLATQGMAPGFAYATAFTPDGPVSEVKSMFTKDTPAVPQPTGSDAASAAEPADDDLGALHAAAADELDWDEIARASSAYDSGLPEIAAPEVKTDVVRGVTALSLDDIINGNLADLIKVEAKAEGGADKNRGGAENLRKDYVHGKTAAKIRWGQDGDFGRCVDIAGKHMRPDQAKGYCNLRHKDALGVYAGQEHKSLGMAAAEALAATWNPLLEVGDHAGNQPPVEAKSIEGTLPGSMEERKDQIRQKLEPMLRALHEGDDEDSATPTTSPWVEIVGTWPDRVVATVHDYSTSSATNQTYEVEYVLDGEEVRLGDPEPVELRVTIDRDGDDEGDDDGQIAIEDLLPIADLIGLSATGMKSILAATEVKAGRVLSGSNESRLRGAVEHLLAVLAGAGVRVAGTDSDTQAPAEVAPDTTAPSATGGPTEKKSLVISDFDAVLADLTSTP